MIRPSNTGNMMRYVNKMLEVLHNKALKHGKPDEVCINKMLEVLRDEALKHGKPHEVCISKILEVLHDKALKHGKPHEVYKQDARGATR